VWYGDIRNNFINQMKAKEVAILAIDRGTDVFDGPRPTRIEIDRRSAEGPRKNLA
jgi:hypothetical protein